MHSGKRYNFFPPSSLVGCQWNSNLYMQSTVCLCAKAWRRNVITLSIYANKQHTRWKIETTEKVSGLSVSREFLFSVHMAEARNQLQNRRQYPLFIPQYLIFHTWEFCLIFFFLHPIFTDLISSDCFWYRKVWTKESSCACGSFQRCSMQFFPDKMEINVKRTTHVRQQRRCIRGCRTFVSAALFALFAFNFLIQTK